MPYRGNSFTAETPAQAAAGKLNMLARSCNSNSGSPEFMPSVHPRRLARSDGSASSACMNRPGKPAHLAIT